MLHFLIFVAEKPFFLEVHDNIPARTMATSYYSMYYGIIARLYSGQS